MCQKLPVVLLRTYYLLDTLHGTFEKLQCARCYSEHFKDIMSVILSRALLRNYPERSMVVHACNPVLQKLRQECLYIPGQPWLHTEFQAIV